jgi:hypothetical protein
MELVTKQLFIIIRQKILLLLIRQPRVCHDGLEISSRNSSIDEREVLGRKRKKG